MTILDEILLTKNDEVKLSQSIIPLKKLKELPRDSEIRDFEQALSCDIISVIAEIKRKSPSAGEIWMKSDPIDIAKAYETSGASAISILTDKTYFGGSLDFMKAVRDCVNLPILRKDFIVSEYQIWESYVHGADAILLIADALSSDQLKQFYTTATQLGLHVLVETHNPDLLEQIHTLQPKIVGVNCRDLNTMKTDLNWFENLSNTLPSSSIKVAESGINSVEDLQLVSSLGFNAALIGTSLMKNGTPQHTLSNLLNGVGV